MNKENFYQCQLKVPRFEQSGQESLDKAKCLIIGVGGLGCPVAQYLCASGVGNITLCDADFVDKTSISRQILFTLDDIGKKKAEVAQQYLQARNPYISISSSVTHIGEANWQALSNYDLVIDCTDNFNSKYIIHDACMLLKINLVQASIYQNSGQVLFYDFASSDPHACMRCLWEDIPPVQFHVDCVQSGVLSVVAGSVGITQANIALQVLLHNTTHIVGRMHMFDWELLDWTTIKVPKKTQCVCNNEQTIKTHAAYLYNTESLEVSELPLKQDAQYQIIDVRNEKDQYENSAFGERQVIQLAQKDLMNFKEYALQLDHNTEYILVCYKGIRSYNLAKTLREVGCTKAKSYIGGYNRLAQLMQ